MNNTQNQTKRQLALPRIVTGVKAGQFAVPMPPPGR